MTLASVARHLEATRRRHGLGTMVKLLTLATLRRTLTVERCHIFDLHEPPEVAPERGRALRLATADDITRLARAGRWDLDTDAAELLEREHRCVLNLVDGEVAGYAWLNPHRLVVPRLRAAWSLRSGEVHVYKGFTHPAFRGRNLGVDRFAFWLTRLEGEAPRRLLTDFAFDNPATLARAGRTGLRHVGSGTYLARGDREHRMLSAELSARALQPIPHDLPHRDH